MDVKDIVRAAQLAPILEVSGYPKPGNVHRTADLEEMTFEQFLASSVAIGPALLDAAEKGFRAGKGEIDAASIGVGKAIKSAIEETRRWQRDENTNLGTVMLLIPLAAAAGMTLAKENKINVEKLRENLSDILRSGTSEDALNVYDAISIANPGGLGKVGWLDVNDKDSKRRIKKEQISIYEIMKVSSKWDNVSKEWITGMRITFEFGYPFLKRIFEKTKNINTTTVQTFLEILSRYLDTFVVRIHGEKVAKEVSKEAKLILERGGMLTIKGRKLIARFDRELRRRDINPGTTADLTASSWMLAILDGLRP